MARKGKAPAAGKSVEAHRHEDAKRRNIPTAEYQSVVQKEAEQPLRVAYERRNKDLDPQLVWRGKDQQDWSDLVVPAPPLYIQEKVHPKALIDDLLRDTRERQHNSGELHADLFSDFNGIPKGVDRTEFYQHDQNWSNRMILGDSLQVMASLAEKEGLKGKVQCIYFDPPYGIKFGSNWQVSTRKLEVKDGKAGDATRQPEQIRAFRDTWQLGIHSYLGYLRDRFVSARDLLTETGSIFVQIGDENVHLVRCVLDEVFGSETFCGQIVFKKTTGLTSDLIPGVCDYLLWYAKSVGSVKYRQLYLEKTLEDEVLGEFKYVDIGNGQFRLLTEEEKRNPQLIDETQLFRTNSAVSPGVRTNTTGKWDFEGNVFDSGPSRNWKTTYPGMVRLAGLGRLIFSNDPSRMYKQYWKDFPL